MPSCLIWSRRYEFSDTLGDAALNYITDISSTPDSTIVLTGLGDGIGDEFVVAELDSNGVQIWAESYTFSSVNNGGDIRNISCCCFCCKVWLTLLLVVLIWDFSS